MGEVSRERGNRRGADTRAMLDNGCDPGRVQGRPLDRDTATARHRGPAVVQAGTGTSTFSYRPAA